MSAAARPAVAPLSAMLRAQTVNELRARWRVFGFSLTSLVLPVVLFTFFGLPFARADAPGAGAHVLASFGAYAVGQVMVFGFGIGVAVERGQRIDLLVRTTPLPPAVFLAAKVLVALFFALLSLAVLMAYAALVGVRVPVPVAGTMMVRLLAGSVPFIALGFAIGYSAGPNAAPAVANLVYLPLAFGSGLFLPLRQLPALVRDLAPYLPTYHYAQLAWSAVGTASAPVGASLAWLLAYSVIFGALALRAYRREERVRFG